MEVLNLYIWTLHCLEVSLHGPYVEKPWSHERLVYTCNY